MASWPATLPDFTNFLQDSYTEALADNVIRTDMEIGPAKVRRRSSAAPQLIEGRLRLKTAQLTVFKTFYEDTIFFGALAFDAVHPRTAAAISARFAVVPQISASGIDWIAALKIEVLP